MDFRIFRDPSFLGSVFISYQCRKSNKSNQHHYHYYEMERKNGKPGGRYEEYDNQKIHIEKT